MTTPSSPPPRRRRKFGYGKVMSICVGLGLLTGAGAAMVGHFGLVSQPLAYAGAVLAAGAGALWASYKWWNDVDEGVREAHKTSWFWGGSCGMLVVGAVALALFGITQGEVAEQFGLTRQDAGMMLTGITLTVVTMLIGYGLWWAGWWFTRSR